MRVRFPSPQAALTIAAVIFAAVWGIFLGFWHLEGRASPLDRLEAPLVDLRFLIAGPRPAPAGVAIVAIDDDAVREAGAYPLPRALVARLVRELARHGPKAVALDLLFIEPGSADADQALSEALRATKAVVGAAALFGRDAATNVPAEPLDATPLAERLLWPTDQIGRAAAVGLVNITTDQAGTPRHVPLIVRLGPTLLPSFPLRTVSIATGADAELEREAVSIDGVRTTTDLGYSLPLRFYGRRGTISTVSAGDVLRGAVPDGVLRDRILLVGATAIGTGDMFATPFDPVLPGIEVLATAVGHLVAGDGLVRSTATRRVDGIVALVLPVATILFIALRRIGVGLLLVSLIAVLWMALTVLAFMKGYWLHITVPLAAVIPPAMLYVLARLWLDQRTERQLEAAQAGFRRFHSPALADQLAATPDFLARPVQQQAAVVFIDLTGFTGLSERLGPERTREVLKEFHSLIEQQVTERRGLVLSFMGDGAMIVFGLPRAEPDDAARALEAALALGTDVGAWLRKQPLVAESRLGVRVGAHYGPVVVSRLGSETHQHITATGDSVNVASRLLEVVAAHDALAALSEDLLMAVGGEMGEEEGARRSGFTELRDVAIRGREQHLRVRLWRAREGAAEPPVGNGARSPKSCKNEVASAGMKSAPPFRPAR